jgi:hypothetical protein
LIRMALDLSPGPSGSGSSSPSHPQVQGAHEKGRVQYSFFKSFPSLRNNSLFLFRNGV